jgi:mannose-6-phosphate isomerase-like protein (cupin superfamily)
MSQPAGGGRGRVVRFDAAAQRFAPEKMQKVALCASDAFFLDLYCLEPGQAQKPHAHDASAKVYLVMEGRAQVTLGDEELVLEPGEAVMAAAGELHGLRNGTAQRLVVLTLLAPPPHAH